MEEFIKIAALESTLEAQLIQSILNEKKIPHRIQSYHDTAYDGLFQIQKGWGKLCAPPELKEEILAILEMVRSDA